MFRTQRHSSLGEIPRTGRQEKQKGHPKGCTVVRESASSCEVSTGDDEAVFRTHILKILQFSGWVDSDRITKEKKNTTLDWVVFSLVSQSVAKSNGII